MRLLLFIIMLASDPTTAIADERTMTAAQRLLHEQRLLAAAATPFSSGLATETAEPLSTEAVLAAGVTHATRGGGHWHIPSPPPPPLPQLVDGECPSKSLFGCRERDRSRFSAVQWRFRRDAYDAARARHRDSDE